MIRVLYLFYILIWWILCLYGWRSGIKISQVSSQWRNLNEFSYRSISTVRNIIRFGGSNPILQDVAHAPDSSQDIPTSWSEPGPAAALGNQFSEAL